MPGVLFYTIPVGLCVGIFFGSLFLVPNEVVPLLLVLSFVLAVLWRRNSGAVSSPLVIGSVFLLGAGIGLLRFDATNWTPSSLASFQNTEVALEGVVAREPDLRESSQHLYIKESHSGELFLVTTDKFQDVTYGDKVVAEGLLEEPEAFEGELGRTFDYPSYLRARGVEFAMFSAEVSVVGTDAGNPFIAFLLSWKMQFMHTLESFIPEPQVGLAEGLLLGVKRALGDDLESAFRATGIIHIVVLSGYNLMIVADALMRVLSFFFRPVMRMVFGIGAIMAFALLVGLSATVVRASLMAGLLLYARATGRNGHATRALCLAGMVMLFLNPYLLVFDPGFQLSFLATLGLVLVSPAIERYLQFAPTMWKIREYITATIATQIMVLPLLLFLIGEFSVVAVMVNVLVLPMVPVAMFLAFVSGMAGFVLPTLASIIGFAADLSLQYILLVTTLFASLPFASFMVPAFPFWIAAAAYALIAYVLWRFHTRHEESDETEEDTEDEDLADWTLAPLSSLTPQTQKSAEVRSTSADSFPFR